MSNDASILAAMQKFLWRSIEGGRAALIQPPTGTVITRTQLCRVDVPMWMAGGWVLTVGPPPSKGKAPLQELPDGLWPVDTLDSYVEITFGHGSAVHTVQVDIGRGLRICLYASTVSVEVVQPPNLTGGFVFGYPYRLPGSLVRGELGDGNHCHRTVVVADIPVSSTSDVYPVPPFARNVRLLANQGTSPTPSLFFHSRAGSVLQQTVRFRNTNQEYKLGDPTILPSETTGISVENQSVAVVMTHVRLIFELHL